MNNPLHYIDPDGKDWHTAWSDVKIFASSIYARVSAGGGAEGKIVVGHYEARVGADVKATLGFEQGVAGKLSGSVDVGAKVGIKDGPSVGENITASRSIERDEDGRWKNGESLTYTDSIGGHYKVSTSKDEIGIAVEGGFPVVLGAELGTTKQGLVALGDAVTQVKDEIKSVLQSREGQPQPNGNPCQPAASSACQPKPESH